MSDSEPTHYAKLVTIRDVLVGSRRQCVDRIYEMLVASKDLASAKVNVGLLSEIDGLSDNIAIIDRAMADEQQKVVL